MWPPCTPTNPPPAGMAETRGFYLAAFSSAKGALTAQRAFAQAEIETPMMPTPREIAAHCGLSLRFAPELLPRVKEALAGSGMAREEYTFYSMEYGGGSRVVIPLK